MRVYSFNRVIYDGVLTRDLIFFFIRQKFSRFFKLLVLLPLVIGYIFKKTKVVDILEKLYEIILNEISISELELFKATNLYKVDLKGFGIIKDNPNDIIISVEPTFLIDLFINRNKFNVICTGYDIRARKIIGNLCVDAEKVRRLKLVGIYKIEQLFIYSFEEKEVMGMANYIFVYRHSQVIELDAYKPNLIDKLSYNFVNHKLITFLTAAFILGLTTSILATIFTIFMNVLDSFILWYIIYFIVITFLGIKYLMERKFDVKVLLAYLLGFLPNFLFLLLIIIIFGMLIGIPNGFTLILGFIIAFPFMVYLATFKDFD